MRKLCKKSLAIALTLLLAFGALSVVSFAENGPCDEGFAFLRLVELNDDGTSKQNTDGEFVMKTLYLAEHGPFEPRPLDEVDGAVYDKGTNTLTLTDFDGVKYLLSVNMMGDDFALALKGSSKLGGVTVYGDGWGGSLRVTGDGTLTVNEKKLLDSAIAFHPEGIDMTFTVDPDVTLNLAAKEAVIVVDGTEQAESPLALGTDAVEVKRETYVWHGPKLIFVYEVNPTYYYSSWHSPAVCRDDPDGIYTIDETQIWREGEDPVDKIEVKHFWYVEKYDQYVEDYHISGEYGESSLFFDSYDEAKAAGFEPKAGAEAFEIKTGGGNGPERVYTDGNGVEYVTCYTKISDSEYGDVCARVETVPGMEDAFICVPDLSVKEEDLSPVEVDEVIEGEYRWSVPKKELTLAPRQEPPAHEHAFELKKDATGHWQECACGEIKDKAAHTPGDWIVDKAPTATEGGLQHKECTVCGYVTTSVTTLPTGEQPPAHEHTPEVIPGKDATCTQDGLTDGERCSVCGEILKAQETIPATGHTPSSTPAMPPTCTETGLTERTVCFVCGEILKAQEIIPATGHTDADGNGKCDVCGADLSAPAGLRGDANLDGKVLANDARLVLRASAKLETIEGQGFINCDLNADGKLLAGEARKILRFSAKLETVL